MNRLVDSLARSDVRARREPVDIEGPRQGATGGGILESQIRIADLEQFTTPPGSDAADTAVDFILVRTQP